MLTKTLLIVLLAVVLNQPWRAASMVAMSSLRMLIIASNARSQPQGRSGWRMGRWQGWATGCGHIAHHNCMMGLKPPQNMRLASNGRVFE